MEIDSDQILLLSELAEQNTEIKQELADTRQELEALKRAFDDLAFEHEWTLLILSDERAHQAHTAAAEISDITIKELQHAYRLTKDRKRLLRFANTIIAKFNRGTLTHHHPDNVRAELETKTARVHDKGEVNGVQLGWDWNGKEFWTEIEANKARQDHIDTTVAERSKSYAQ